jgi:hypothetical protein
VRDAKRVAYMSRVMEQMLGDLQHPVGKDGTTVYAEGFKAIVAWHLVRAGWRKPNNLDEFPLVEAYDDPVIKKRKVFGPGVLEDAVEWVGFDEPDDPLEHLADMTMGEIEALPEHLRIEAKRRLGLIGDPAPANVPNFGVEEWATKPLVRITDEEDS